jgi:hypothetical protein
MRSIDRVVKDGFILSAPHQEFFDRALLSLRIALRADFSTYREKRGRLGILGATVSGLSEEENQRVIDYHHQLGYCEAYS